MRMNLTVLTCLLSILSGHAYVTSSRGTSFRFARVSTSHKAVNYEAIEDVAYSASASKPLGVVFGENPQPYGGLVVDDVEPGLNGGAAGLRAGDQLLAINGQTVVGSDFDSVMSLLRDASDPMDLNLFRGTVRQLYTILENRNAVEDDEIEDGEEIVLDEDYESPVVVPVDDDVDYDAPLTSKEVFNAFKKIGGIVAESVGSNEETKKEKKGGLFGGMFGGETIQLDGDDATSLK